MTTLPSDTFWDTSKTEGEASAGWFYKILDIFKELPGGAEQVPELTISSGSITPSAADASRGASFTVDTESDAASDDLNTIAVTNTPEGRVLILKANNTARTVVIKHEAGGSGQISLIDGVDFSLDDNKKSIILQLQGTTWYEIARGDNFATTTDLASGTYTFTNKTFDADGTGNVLTNIDNANIKAGATIDATKIGGGSVDNTEFGYLNGVSSGIQNQLDAKLISSSEGVIKGWINFNGTGTPSISDSYNVSGTITDHGTGEYTITWDTDFANANYSVVGMASGSAVIVNITSLATGSCRIAIKEYNNTFIDPAIITLIAIGDQ